MADRGDLLGRLVTALEQPGVDGVLGTADVLDDLLLLGALDGKVVFGSMNRGGLAGSVFELDDRFTAYDAPSLSSMGFDGGKMLVRIALDEAETANTLEGAANAVSALADHGLTAMVEPFMSERRDSKVANIRGFEQLRRARPHARAAVLSPLLLEGGHGRDQLPALLRRERAGRGPHGRRRGLP
jgi:hypothetical protein